eukprot:7275548-Prymnesium_polylepis.1
MCKISLDNVLSRRANGALSLPAGAVGHARLANAARSALVRVVTAGKLIPGTKGALRLSTSFQP